MKTIQLISYPLIIEEAQRNMKEAVEVYLESIAERTKYIPKPLKFYQSTIHVKLPA